MQPGSRRAKVTVFGNPNRVAEVNLDATDGAIVGVNLRRKDGSLITEEDLQAGGVAAAQAFSRDVFARATQEARRQLEFLRGNIDQAIADANAAAQQIRTELLADVADLESQIDTVEDAIFRVDTANPGLLQTIEGIKFDVEDANGFIAESLRADSSVLGSIIVQRLNALKLQVEGAYTALVASEATARQTADGLLTRRADMLDSVLQLTPAAPGQPPSTASSAALSALQTSISSVDGRVTSEATRINSLQAAINSPSTGLAANANNIAQVRAAVTDPGNGQLIAVASALNSIGARVGEAEADVSSLSEVVVGPAGAGQNPPLLARHSLRVNANGRIAGMVFESNQTTSSIDFLANVFRISIGDSPGQSIAPFTVQPDPENGNLPTVFMTNAKIDAARINDLTVNRINGGTIGSQWDMRDANGRIVMRRQGPDGVRRMKVLGAGFSSAANGGPFIEWFGPDNSAGTRDPNTVTAGEAISYVKTNGDVFFAGSITAGPVFNIQQTNSYSPVASLSLQHPGTGRPFKVILSYRCENSGTRLDASPPPLPALPNATLLLTVTGPGGFSFSQSYSVSSVGTRSSAYQSGESPWFYLTEMSLTQTVVLSNVTQAGLYTVTAQITSRSIGAPGGNPGGLDNQSQNITLSASEPV